MDRVMIIGCSGSGKSTLARALHKLTNLPLIHLDQYFWKPNWVETLDPEWEEINQALVEKSQWIIDGNYGRTMDLRLKAAETIIFLDRPTWLCFYRVVRRILQYYGTSRPDMTEGCNERMDMVFFKYVLSYNRNRRPGILAKLTCLSKDKDIIILKNDSEIEEFLESR